MKILHVNQTDTLGGAAKAAMRLHKGLLDYDLESSFLVLHKYSDDKNVIKIQSLKNKLIQPYLPKIDRFRSICYPNRDELFSSGYSPFSRIVNFINELNPDIVHFHWINGGMINLKDISKIRSKIFWSLHDMWPFTGGCHYSLDCSNYKYNCGKCRVLKSKKRQDLSSHILHKKLKIYHNSNITFVCLSKWMLHELNASLIGGQSKSIHLPNPIDIEIFKPIEKSIAKAKLNLAVEKKYILFGAMNATDDIRKGFHFLKEMLCELDKSFEIIVFGANDGPNIFDIPTHYLGIISDKLVLRKIYSAADVFISPSIQENLSNAIMESMACGTPVVAFDIGGNSDMIDHLVNGYLASPYNCRDLAIGVKWCMKNDIENLARLKIIENFSKKIVIPKYIRAYGEYH